MTRAYGPPRLEHPPPSITVGGTRDNRGERELPQHPAIVEQRRQINALAYLAGLEAAQLEEDART